MTVPLEKRLRKKMHVEIAKLQDEVVEILYMVNNEFILHGGTAIWRCYKGNRFSEDLDFYFQNLSQIEEKLKTKINERGLILVKYKKTKNLVFCKISNGSVEIRVEINYSARKEYVSKSFEKTDGTFMTIFTLSLNDLVLEKVNAYKNRKFIRDLYDIYHLSNEECGANASLEIKKLLTFIPKPIDENNIKVLVYSGAIPTFTHMVAELKKRFG